MQKWKKETTKGQRSFILWLLNTYFISLFQIKDMKSIYTNRALAYIKLKKFKKAINDCTNVIEYMEVFEKVG